MKIWELENFDFSVPWFYIYNETEIDKNNERCNNIFKICDSNFEYKQNYIQFFGVYKLYGGLTDFYYIPNKYIMNFIELAQKMYAENVFLEWAVPAIFAIISASKYQSIYVRPLWFEERNKAIKILHKEFQQIFIHPIKFSSDKNKEEVNKYIFFINANDF